MTISTKVIADSINPYGNRLTTLQLRYPRFVHAEFMTHRVFSRNASSSRAIPVKKLIEDILRDPAMPIYWGANQAGMQAAGELATGEIALAKHAWLEGLDNAIIAAQAMMDIGLHKQIANRVLEPWAHINVVVSATEWDNFFALRCHPDAQPEMRVLAECIRDVMALSTPVERRHDRKPWHLPYIDTDEFVENGVFNVEKAAKCSAARCARVSYLTHDGKAPVIADDLALFDRLAAGNPIHASPLEHQACADRQYSAGDLRHPWYQPELHRNFVGFVQHRALHESFSSK